MLDERLCINPHVHHTKSQNIIRQTFSLDLSRFVTSALMCCLHCVSVTIWHHPDPSWLLKTQVTFSLAAAAAEHPSSFGSQDAFYTHLLLMKYYPVFQTLLIWWSHAATARCSGSLNNRRRTSSTSATTDKSLL